MGLKTSKSISEETPSRAEGQPVVVSTRNTQTFAEMRTEEQPGTIEGEPALKAKIRAALAQAAEQESEEREVKMRKSAVEFATMKAWVALVMKHFTAYVQANEASLLALLKTPRRDGTRSILLEMPIETTADLFKPYIDGYYKGANMTWHHFLYPQIYTTVKTRLTNLYYETFRRATQELLGIPATISSLHCPSDQMTYIVGISL
jgi:hypothetical protein